MANNKPLTAKTAKKRALQLWNWLAKNSDKNKEYFLAVYPTYSKNCLRDCALCEFLTFALLSTRAYRISIGGKK